MYFDRFDIVEAYYLFFSLYHEGQGSEKYQRLSRITGYFEPKKEIHYATLSDNGKAIFQDLLWKERHGRR